MKIMFLPPKPFLTKKGTVRKRNKGTMMPGRVFLENGYEIPGLCSLMVESEEPERIRFPPISNSIRVLPRHKYRTSKVTLEFLYPEVVIIDKPPATAYSAVATPDAKQRKR